MRTLTTNLTLGLLVIGNAALTTAMGCSSKAEDPPAQQTNMAGATGTAGAGAGTGGATGGNAGAATVAGAGAGGATGGTAGTVGAGGGVPPNAEGRCGLRSVLHPEDNLCYCQPATLTMCSDGCHDPMKDPDHCGMCEHACEASSACNMGLCTTPPTEEVAAAAGCGSISLAVAGGTLYWASAMTGTVQSQAAGGTPTMVATGQMGPKSLQIHGDALYWMNTGTNEVMTVPLAGGTPTALVTAAMITDTNPEPPNMLFGLGGYTVADTTIYFADGRYIYSMPLAGGTPAEVGHEDSGVPKALAVENGLIVYPASVNGDIDVMTITPGTPAVCASEDSMTATNLNCGRIARSQGALNLDVIYLIGGNAYWANQASFQTSSAVTPTGINDLVANGSPDASKLESFTVNGTMAYFGDDTGNVWSAPLMVMSTATKLARAQMGITSFAADDAKVYWANGDCSIQSLPASTP